MYQPQSSSATGYGQAAPPQRTGYGPLSQGPPQQNVINGPSASPFPKQAGTAYGDYGSQSKQGFNQPTQNGFSAPGPTPPQYATSPAGAMVQQGPPPSSSTQQIADQMGSMSLSAQNSYQMSGPPSSQYSAQANLQPYDAARHQPPSGVPPMPAYGIPQQQQQQTPFTGSQYGSGAAPPLRPSLPSQYGSPQRPSYQPAPPPGSQYQQPGAPPSSQFPAQPPTSQHHGSPSVSQYGAPPLPQQSHYQPRPPTSSQYPGAPQYGQPPTSQVPASGYGSQPPQQYPGAPLVSSPAQQGVPGHQQGLNQAPVSMGPQHTMSMPGSTTPTMMSNAPISAPQPGYGLSGPMPPSSQYGGQQPPTPGQQGYQQPYGSQKGMSPMPPVSQSIPRGPQSPMGQSPSGFPPQPAQAPPPQRRLDPDQMPSPIQVYEDDRRNRSDIFNTSQRGQVPPLVTTPFVAQDGGNCSPRFIRSTVYNVPCTSDMCKQSQVPIAISICPFAKQAKDEKPIPIVNFGDLGPVRCVRCKAYMSPFMTFIDGGRRFTCSFCNGHTDVPQEYFQHLDHTGQRTDKWERPELHLGSYEFVATREYCKNNQLPNPPAYIFMIDVSYNSIKSGMVYVLCSNIRQLLQNLPRDYGEEQSSIRVGFVTYSHILHFYNLKNGLTQPQMMVVADVQDVFLPLLDGFLVNLHESEELVDSLLEQIPQMFAETRETETVLGPVIQAGLDALKAAECPGKLYVFHSSLPIAEAPGKLKNRDDRKLLGTDKEKTILTPQTPFYTKLGQECVSAGCSVDLFLFPNAYIDIATVGEICSVTGGQLYRYNYFQADLDGQRFIRDLKHNLERPIVFDAIMRVRTSTGIRPVEFLGNFYMSNTTDIELASLDSDKAIAVEIRHDDKLVEEDGAFIQVATLFTSVGGRRRLRLHNLSLNCCSMLADMYKNCELDTMINYFAKQCVKSIVHLTPQKLKESLIQKTSQILATYRRNCASPSSAGQLILPECMKLLPLYVNCVLKSDALQGLDLNTDDRSWLMQQVMSMDVRSSVPFFYPQLIPLHDVNVKAETLPTAIRCSIERFKDDGVYLLENGVQMFIWVGQHVSHDWLQKVFSIQSAAHIDPDKTKLVDLDNPLSVRIRGIVSEIQSERHRSMKLVIIRQRDKLEAVLRRFLVEDRGNDGSASYVDFLCHMHKEIRNLLN